jgi:hypothetical protein
MKLTENLKLILLETEIESLNELDRKIKINEPLVDKLMTETVLMYKKHTDIIRNALMREQKNKSKINKERKEQNRLNKLKGKNNSK